MRTGFLGLPGLLLWVGSALGQTQTATVPSAQIRTSGSASIPVPADLATITIEFITRAKTPRAAGRVAAQRANAIRQALIAVGIPQDSMPTGGRWGYWGARSQRVIDVTGRDTAYVSTDVFTARVRNLDLLGRVIDTALVQGATTISNIAFTATETHDAHIAALRQATQQARANAEIMAQAAGGRLGALLEITTDPPSYGPRPFQLEEIVASGASESSSSTTVVAPQLRVTVSVYGRWTFEQTKP